MRIPSKSKDSEIYRLFEVGGVVAFVLVVVLILLFNPSTGGIVTDQAEPIVKIEAYASAMPNQGWAPMTVYFSAFGSESQAGHIVKYEWDLDANGLYDTDATEKGGYVSYYYAKPGEYTITLRVIDDQGNTATDSVVINVRHPASSSVDYRTVFDDSEVRRVDISLTTADWQYMWTDPEAKIEVPADAIVFGERLDNIGFRMRGQWSLRGSGEKKPWKINTDAYIEGQEFHNLKQLVFVNSLEDPSLIQEKMAYDLMHFAGVPASHVCYVEIWIDFTDDDEPPIFLGVYTMIERVDNKFVANRFGRDNKGGNLYKASLAQRGPMDLVYHGDRIEDYPTQGGLYNIGKANNEEEADYSDILNFIRVIDGVKYETPEDFAQALEQVFNVDGFLRYMAAAVTLSGWDIYPYAGNNYYLYNNPGTGKFEWIPWDLTWGGNPEQPLFGREGLGFLERAPLYDRVFEVERYRVRYAAYLDLLNREWFTYENVSTRVERFHEMIAPYVTQGTGDKMYFGDTAMYPIEAFNNTWKEFGNFARQRSNFVLTTLAQGQWRSSDFDHPSSDY